MRRIALFVLCLVWAGLGAGSADQNPANTARPAPAGINRAAMDTSVNPCTDFYQYACGNWIKTHPIPADQSGVGTFTDLALHNAQVERKILEDNEAPRPSRTPVEAEVGDYYAACMDESRTAKLGASPLDGELARIAALQSVHDLGGEIGHLQAEGVPALFTFGSTQDAKDATQMIAAAGQGGLTLPDRDYYLKNDPKSVQLRRAYVAHVARMLTLLGDKNADSEARAILALETELAQTQLTIAQRRDPDNVYHRMDRAGLAALAPDFDWPAFYTNLGAPSFAAVNVAEPDYFRAVNRALGSVSLADWQDYLRWHLLNATADLLSPTFVNAQFAFTGVTMNGQKELQPRWRRCAAATDRQLGEALGQLYVKVAFGPNAKVRMNQMVVQLEAAMQEDISHLPWMTPATRQAAIAKLHAITRKIGYPDTWRDYSAIQIRRDDYVGNTLRANAFEVHWRLNLIGKPVDRSLWGMTTPTVNAYYQPSQNEIVFPAGILEPPFYDPNRDDAANFGAIGAVIGHEMTHAFDDQGARYDGQGNLRDWWAAADKEQFETRVSCIANEYSHFVVVGLNLNGRNTLGENAADNGGVRIAYMAFMAALAGQSLAGNPPLKVNATNAPIDGFTPQQRFFLGFAQIWCENRTPEALRNQVLTNPHSPGQFRVNGVMVNMPEFSAAFHCGPGQAMYAAPATACRVW